MALRWFLFLASVLVAALVQFVLAQLVRIRFPVVLARWLQDAEAVHRDDYEPNLLSKPRDLNRLR